MTTQHMLIALCVGIFTLLNVLKEIGQMIQQVTSLYLMQYTI